MDDKDAMVLITPDGMSAKSDDRDKWNGIRAGVEVYKGKYMYEVSVGKGLCRMGWASATAKLNLGTDDRGFGFGGTGKKSWNSKFEDYGDSFGEGDVIGCLLDRESQQISFCKNGRAMGVAFDLPHQLHSSGLKPALCGKGFQLDITFDNFNFPVDGFEPLAGIKSTDTLEGLTTVFERAGKQLRHPLCLILEPTRDLAQQTYDCMVEYGKYLQAPRPRIALFVAGIDEKGQREALQQGVDIAVGTLMRIMDFVRKGQLDISHLKFFVLDEADELMKNDDRKDIPRIKQQAASKAGGSSKIQTLFFSATLHGDAVRSAIERITISPSWVDAKGKPAIPETVHFVCYKVNAEKDLPFTPVNPKVTPQVDKVHHHGGANGRAEQLSERTKNFKPQIVVKIADALKMPSCLVFCRTNLDCDNLEQFLVQLGGGRGFAGAMESGKENPYSCVVLAGMRDQQERQRNLEHFHTGSVRFLICTDVAARGIDIKGLPYLMMLTLPDDPDQFFHRVGRVGRADTMGLAISIVATAKEQVWYHKCANRGKGCTNTRLVEQGGCTIWYDEPEYLKAIEEKIGQKIPEMDPTSLAVEGILDPVGDASLMQVDSEKPSRRALAMEGASSAKAGVAGTMGDMVLYGKAKNDEGTRSVIKQIQQMEPILDELKQLEVQAQRSFLRGMWGMESAS
eukprot:GHVN01068889.1.p1 GENE.GHVN01068889.1~~GHVN01068889.1.p1  ORF type:complete len:780 (+),score=115.74 GHVN01068889.1:303-2342(+)